MDQRHFLNCCVNSSLLTAKINYIHVSLLLNIMIPTDKIGGIFFLGLPLDVLPWLSLASCSFMTLRSSWIDLISSFRRLTSLDSTCWDVATASNSVSTHCRSLLQTVWSLSASCTPVNCGVDVVNLPRFSEFRHLPSLALAREQVLLRFIAREDLDAKLCSIIGG